jgi:hypothetical protein
MFDQFQIAARARWPKADIKGEGPWCFLIACYANRGVRLFESETDCRAAARKDCGHVACCVHSHHVLKLQAFQLPQVLPISMADRFRDKYDDKD